MDFPVPWMEVKPVQVPDARKMGPAMETNNNQQLMDLLSSSGLSSSGL
jgi:hypothetical protein